MRHRPIVIVVMPRRLRRAYSNKKPVCLLGFVPYSPVRYWPITMPGITLTMPWGLNFRGSLTLEPEHKPAARHVLLMAQRVQQEKIACLLAEPGADAALARRIFGAQAFHMAVVDELFASTPRGPQGYAAAWNGMATAIERCLAGR
jgi:hypothetical protein